VSAQNAKDAADEIVAKLRLSAADKGRKFQLVTFASEADCRFFYPHRALEWQRQVNTYVSRALRERYGVRVQRISLTPDDFNSRPEVEVSIIGQDGIPPTAQDAKRKFADSHLRFLD
jgi:hypothetical protein